MLKASPLPKPDEVDTLNTPTTPYFFFLNAKNVIFTFLAVVSFSKHISYFCSYFKTSKYVRPHILCCLFGCKIVVSVPFCSLTLEWTGATDLVAFSRRKISFVLCFWISDHWLLFFTIYFEVFTRLRHTLSIESKDATVIFL